MSGQTPERARCEWIEGHLLPLNMREKLYSVQAGRLVGDVKADYICLDCAPLPGLALPSTGSGPRAEDRMCFILMPPNKRSGEKFRTPFENRD